MTTSPFREQRISPWINWFVILSLGPVIAFFLADVCGFEGSVRTFQIIILVEVCLVAAGVGLLILVQTMGPWTDREHQSKEWLRLMKPEPGSMLADLAAAPDQWNRSLDNYLRSNWREIAPGGSSRPQAVSLSPIAAIRSSAQRQTMTAMLDDEPAPPPVVNRPRPPQHHLGGNQPAGTQQRPAPQSPPAAQRPSGSAGTQRPQPPGGNQQRRPPNRPPQR